MAEPMRLQKYLAHCGVASRRAAEGLIVAGRVAVNGLSVQTLGSTVTPGQDTVTLDGKPVVSQEEPVYIMLHKPRGYVTTVSDELGRKTVMELLPEDIGRVYPVGRLDFHFVYGVDCYTDF